MDAPAVAVSADGKKLAFGWMDMRNRAGDRDVWWLLPGRSREEALAEKSDGEQGHVSLAMDEDGTVYAAWYSETNVVVRSSKSPRNDIVNTEAAANYPSIAVRGEVKVVVYECKKDGRNVVVCRAIP